jgi:hypothetical protein
MKPLEELSATETMLRLIQMDDNVQSIKRACIPGGYEAIRAYIGLNYDRHVRHLEQIGLKDSAAYFAGYRRTW